MDDLCLEDAYIESLRDKREISKTLSLMGEWIEEWTYLIADSDDEMLDSIEDKFLLGRGEHGDDLMKLRCKREAKPELIDLFHYAHIYRVQTGDLDLTKYE